MFVFALLAPGLLLYYCLCLSLFPPEVLAEQKVSREGGREGGSEEMMERTKCCLDLPSK